MTTTNRKNTSYQDAGVNIERGNLLVERIKKTAARTHGPAVMGGLGGFGALYDISCLPYKNPVLVSGTDGVGRGRDDPAAPCLLVTVLRFERAGVLDLWVTGSDLSHGRVDKDHVVG